MSSSRSRLASASVEAAPSVEAGGANGSLGARAQLRQRLAGLSYDEQVALVRPSHPGSPNAAQVQMMGSAMMVTSSGAQEVTRVGVFTPALAKALEENDDASLDQILRETAGTVMTEGSEAHPTLAELGELTSPLDPERTPSLMATGVANSRYSGIGAVPSWKEAEPFMAALSGRGFDTELHQDLTAPEMGSRYDAAFAKAQPGDQVVVSYVGHGDTGVLIGVEHQWPVGAVDELPYERLINASAAAVKRGAHVRLIITACMSGSGAQLMRQKVLEEIKGATKSIATSVEAQELLAAADEAQKIRSDLIGLQDNCARERAELKKLRDSYQNVPLLNHPTLSLEECRALADKTQAKMDSSLKSFDNTLQRAWNAYQLDLRGAAKLAAARLGEAPVAVPKSIGTGRVPDFKDPRLTLGPALDAIDDVTNALIAAAIAEMS